MDTKQLIEGLNAANKSVHISHVLNSPTTSYWLKSALRSALNRDCVDAAHDAEVLAQVLRAYANQALGITER